MTFNNFSIENHTDFLASFLPNGRLMKAKFVEGTVLRKYLTGKAEEFKRLNDLFVTFINELDPRITTDFIDEWESSLGLPDACIPIASTIEERRENVVLKLVSLSVQTEQDYKDLASILGFTISFQNDQFLPHDLPYSFEAIEPLDIFLPHALPYFFIGDISGPFATVITGNFSTNTEKAEIFLCLVKILSPSPYRVVLINTN